MSYQPLTLLINIARKARLWPEISKETVLLPVTPTLAVSSSFSLPGAIFFSLCSLFLCIATLLFGYPLPELDVLVPCAIVSGILALGLFVVYSTRYVARWRSKQQARQRYQWELQQVEKRLQLLHRQERQTHMELSPPLYLAAPQPNFYEHLTITPILNRSFNGQDGMLWARRRGDPDFLALRFGMGQRSASYTIQEAANEQPGKLKSVFADLNKSVHELQHTYSTLATPLTLPLYGRAPMAIVGSYQALSRARAVAQNLIAQLVYHHSPHDVRIILLAPQSQNVTWQWMRALPHTLAFDATQENGASMEALQMRSVAIGAYAVNEQLAALSRELSRRELLLHDRSSKSYALASPGDILAQLPHLVIVVDYFDSEEETNAVFYTEQGLLSQPLKPTPSELSPLQRAELMRALYHGPRLGVSVLCISADQRAIPVNSSAVLRLNGMPGLAFSETTPLPSVLKQQQAQPAQGSSAATQNATAEQKDQVEAILYELLPDPPPALICQQLDIYPPGVLHEFARRVQHLRAVVDKRPDIRSQVDLRTLFTPPLETTGSRYMQRWHDPIFRTPSFTGKSSPLLRVPIGMKYGDELQHLDLLKDGPHGLLVGQAGSGKSELLQTLLLSLVLAYRPSELLLLLIDQGASQTLSAFRTLPHTLSYLGPEPSQAMTQRFLTMLRAEIESRESSLREGKTSPHLLIAIDECLSLSEHADALLDELLTLASTKREYGIHLLFSAESLLPGETNVLAKMQRYQQIREQAQYCLCLRCSTVEESRAAIYRDDAAYLPASLPGRTYLLHHTSQLDLFQAARVNQLITQEPARLLPRHEPSTDKEVVASVTTPIMEA